MQTILVPDTSVLIDLERGDLLELAFQVPAIFAVPDVLYERELKDNAGPRLVELGLRVMELDSDGVILAGGYRRIRRELSVPDSFALALAKIQKCTHLSGDESLRELASTERVECHGVLWLLDWMERDGIAFPTLLHGALTKIGSHLHCRLPKCLINERLTRFQLQVSRLEG